MKKNFFTVKHMCFIGIFAAISVILYSFIPKISLPIFPSFLEINFSMIPILICAFMLGPVDTAICLIVRFLVKLPMSGTGCVGEIADLLIGLPTALTASYIFFYKKCKHKELIAFLSVIVIWIIMAVLTNAFINIPFYSSVFGGMDPIVGACADALKLISFGHITDVTKENFMLYYLFFAVVPFNLLISLIIVLITLPVHRRLKILYERI